MGARECAIALSLASLVVAVAVVVAGCSVFRAPGEAADPPPPARPQGYTAADYQLLDAAGRVARVRVFSDGVTRKALPHGARAVLAVGFTIDNGTGRAMVLELSRLYLDAATADGRVASSIRPVYVDGGVRVPAGLASTIAAEFALPAGMSPDLVAAFRVRWVLAARAARCAHRTSFLKSAATGYAAAAFYYSPFYDPFSGDPFRSRPVMAHDYPFHRRQLF